MSHLKKRLEKIEKKFKIGSKFKSAIVICDPDILHSVDLSMLDVETIVKLPQKECEESLKLKGTYTVKYF